MYSPNYNDDYVQEALSFQLYMLYCQDPEGTLLVPLVQHHCYSSLPLLSYEAPFKFISRRTVFQNLRKGEGNLSKPHFENIGGLEMGLLKLPG